MKKLFLNKLSLYRCKNVLYQSKGFISHNMLRNLFVSVTFVSITGILNAQVLPKQDSPFQGKIDIDPKKSDTELAYCCECFKNAPNIVLILLDDVGFSATSTFGGLTSTPVFDKLASTGLRYNNFNGTPICSPSRAALLSGRNSHQIGFGRIAEMAAGYPGYNTIWPKSAASMAEVLKSNGYSTAAYGKWHNTPVWESSAAGPFDRWPTGLGFEHFYGYLRFGSSQWEPNLYRNTTPVSPSKSAKEGYSLTTDLVDDAINWTSGLQAVANDKPFFLYFAASGTHSPHHAPKEWIDKFKGKFDQGWQKLREETFQRQKQLGIIPKNTIENQKPKELPAWESFSADQKKLLARQMEVYAAYIAYTDYEIGRLLKSLKDSGEMEIQ